MATVEYDFTEAMEQLVASIADTESSAAAREIADTVIRLALAAELGITHGRRKWITRERGDGD